LLDLNLDLNLSRRLEAGREVEAKVEVGGQTPLRDDPGHHMKVCNTGHFEHLAVFYK